MRERVIAVDYDKCTGCRICELTCSMANNSENNPEKARIRIVKIQEYGKMIYMPVVCMNCVKPFCKAVCPTEAIYKNKSTGAMQVDEEKCIGCSACVYGCPFGAISVDRSEGRSFSCNQCEGDPVCVKVCSTNAIEYLDSDEVSMRMRRAGLNRYEEFVNSKSS